MIEDLVAVIDRSWSALEKQTGAAFVLACFPFRDQLLRDARTAQMVDDFRRENREALDDLTRAIETSRTTTLAIFAELEVARPDVVPAMPDANGYDRTGATIRQRLQARAPDPDDVAWNLAQEHEDDRHLDEVVRIVKGLIDTADIDELRTRIHIVQQEIEFAERARRIYFQTSAGAALARVERDLGDLHPPVADRNSNAEVARLCRENNKPLERLYNVIFKNEFEMPDSGDARAIASTIDTLRADMHRIYEEVRRRIGAERSLLSVVQRYRQKCQWYDSERLRVLATNGSGTPEDRLSETLATYLFDHGLNPLTRPLLGRILPDILDTDAGFSFYVEAKQYTRGVPGYLLQGMQQVWAMLDHLRGSGYDVREAFYVVYRRSGPRYSFPPRVSHRDRVVHILLVDIAETSERGSHAPPTRTFSVEELLPGAAVPLDAQSGAS
jgi:hypothetical protein